MSFVPVARATACAIAILSSSLHCVAQELAPPPLKGEAVRLHRQALANHVPGILIKLKDGALDSDALKSLESDAALREAKLQQRIRDVFELKGIRLARIELSLQVMRVARADRPMSLANASGLIEELRKLPEVEYAEPDHRYFPAGTSNDNLYGGHQWFLHETWGIRANTSWDVGNTTPTALVAVLDSGWLPHEDLHPPAHEGYDFVLNQRGSTDLGDGTWANECYAGSPPTNDSVHGLRVGSLIATKTNNNYLLASVASYPSTGLVPNWMMVRVHGPCGGTESQLINGIRWASGQAVAGAAAPPAKARVINISLTSGTAKPCGAAMQSAINSARSNGAVVVVSAGNDSMNAANYAPGNCTGVIVVTATTRTGNLAYYANFGSKVTIAAPGGDVLSNSMDGVAVLDYQSYYRLRTKYESNMFWWRYHYGTSLAAPMVAGVVARMLAVYPTMTESEVISTLASTARPAAPTCDGNCGAGLLDAAAAVAGAKARAPRVNCKTNPRLCA